MDRAEGRWMEDYCGKEFIDAVNLGIGESQPM